MPKKQSIDDGRAILDVLQRGHYNFTRPDYIILREFSLALVNLDNRINLLTTVMDAERAANKKAQKKRRVP
jgi:hypothetical protein